MAVQKNTPAKVISLYAKLQGKAVTEEELLSGLPVIGASDPEGLPRVPIELLIKKAAERAQVYCYLEKCPLEQISTLALPVMLLFKEGEACLLTALKDGEAELLLPETGELSHTQKLEVLKEDYSGYLVYLSSRIGLADTFVSPEKKTSHWFWNAIKLCLPIYFDVLVASFVISLFALVGPLFTMNVYDRVVPNNAVETLWVLAIGTLAVTFFDGVLKFLRTWFTEIAAKKSDMLISSRIFEKVLNLRMEEAPRNVGVFSSCLREYDSIRNFLTSSVMLVVVDLPFTAVLLMVVYMLAGKIVIVPIAMMGLILLYALLVRSPIYASLSANYENSSRKNSLVVETVNGLSEIKHLNSAGVFQGRWEALTAAMSSKAIVTRILSTSVSTLTGVLIQLNTILTVVMGVYMIKDREMTMGALIAIMILSSKIISPIGQLVGLISSWDQTLISFNSLKELMAKEEEEKRSDLITKVKFNGDIEFDDVTFSYPNAEKPALKNVSFKIKKGEKVIVLGRMGAGKSTLHKLLLGFFKPQEGRVLVDNLDIKELSMVQYRNAINYVPQDFYLFSGSIRENILMRNPGASDQALLQAIHAGGLENLIQSSPRGLDTPILERGQNLSGGQRQGIAMARSFIKVGSIILLDEPTNSMDGNTELQVKNFLSHISKGKTLLMTTHKNSMLDLADRILVVDGGKLVFNGSINEFKKAFVKEGGQP